MKVVLQEIARKHSKCGVHFCALLDSNFHFLSVRVRRNDFNTTMMLEMCLETPNQLLGTMSWPYGTFYVHTWQESHKKRVKKEQNKTFSALGGVCNAWVAISTYSPPRGGVPQGGGETPRIRIFFKSVGDVKNNVADISAWPRRIFYFFIIFGFFICGTKKIGERGEGGVVWDCAPQCKAFFNFLSQFLKS